MRGASGVMPIVNRENFVATLLSVEGVQQHLDLLHALILAGDMDVVRDLVDRTLALCVDEDEAWAPPLLVRRAIEMLALQAGVEPALAALAVVDRAHAQGVAEELPMAEVLSLLVSAQSTEAICRIAAETQTPETRLHLLHEAVVWNKADAGSIAIIDAWKSLDAIVDHALSALPRELLAIESQLMLPTYDLYSMMTPLPYNSTYYHAATLTDDSVEHTACIDTTGADRQRLMCTAVRNWVTDYVGRIEARTFKLPDASLPSLPQVLRSVGLACLVSTGALQVRESQSAADVFSVLFSAAAYGGANGDCSYGAIGRLMAWRTLAGLLGLSDSAPVERVAQCAVEASWCLFRPSGGWAEDAVYSLGVACLNPVRNELAVLAAVDTC